MRPSLSLAAAAVAVAAAAALMARRRRRRLRVKSESIAKQMVFAEQGDATVLELVLSWLDAEELVCSIATSRTWAETATSDATWRPRCVTLWEDKVCVPTHLLDEKQSSRILAFWQSIADSQRVALTTDELCSLRWSARVKLASGMAPYDPWWDGRAAGYRQYSPDGTYVSSERGMGQWRWHEGQHTAIRTSRDGLDYPPQSALHDSHPRRR